MIIVEGPDGGGKTRLAQQLAEDLSLKYRRYPGLSSTHGPDGPGIVQWWDEQIAERSPIAIYDRTFYISECLYQMVTPGRALIADGRKMISGQARLANFVDVLIFCIPPEEVAISNTMSGARDKLHNVTEEGLRKLYWAYWWMMGLWKEAIFEKVVHYDYTADDYEWVMDLVIERRSR